MDKGIEKIIVEKNIPIIVILGLASTQSIIDKLDHKTKKLIY